ncbi:HlyD family secretion protein [Stieleria varia]|uniref:HlyD family secretion protein n=1 Tax=Stieleria varia TaxID=2528005 RepID=A0A5C6AT19_9BACT|nr:hypothetical protein [Stieleria varia]TWU02152.1 hypothetical protein Pla52n_32010 [Stieleria varia]
MARRAAWCVLILGVAVSAVAWTVWQTHRPVGSLDGDQLFALRAPIGGQLQTICRVSDVKKGDILAKFSVPRVDDAIESYKEKSRRLQSSKQILGLKPLELDTGLLAAQRVVQSDLRVLRNSLQEWLSEREELSGMIVMEPMRASIQKQVQALEMTIAEVRREIAAAEIESARLSREVERDHERAEHLRAAELDDLDQQLTELRQRIERAESSVAVRAPRDGRIIYQSSSPEFLGNDQPLLVLGPKSGFRFRLRLPESQTNSLSPDESMVIMLDRSHQVRRVRARFHGSDPLPLEPGVALAEFECLLPYETASRLVRGETVSASLDLKTPWATFWPIQSGAALIALGACGLLFLPTAQKRVADKSKAYPPAVQAKPMMVDRRIHNAATPPHLRRLADRFQAAIQARKVDSALISDVESAIVQDQQQAVEVFCDAVGGAMGGAMGDEQSIVHRMESNLSSIQSLLSEGSTAEDQQRLERLLQSITESSPSSARREKPAMAAKV